MVILMQISRTFKKATRFLLIAVTILILINVLPRYVAGYAAQNMGVYSEPIDYSSVVKEVDMDAIKRHVEFFSSFETRSTGYPGLYEAARYIHDKFKEYGLVNVTYEYFTIPECIDHGANITFLSTNETFRIYPMKPNFGAPSTTPPEGITGTLIYARRGRIRDFDGLPVEGSIVLMDWESENNWLIAARLGAKAVIFLPPAFMPTYFVPERADVPFTFPRFYAPQGRLLLEHVGERVTVKANTYWERVKAVNVMGFIPGTEYPNRSVLLTAYFDSGSVCPSLAPGAEESIGISVLLELAKWLSKPENRPKYTIIFLAYSGHHQGLRGAQFFAQEYIWPATNLTKRWIGTNILYSIHVEPSTGSDAAYQSWMGDFLRGMYTYSTYGPTNQAYFMIFVGKIIQEINAQKPAGRAYEFYMDTTTGELERAAGIFSIPRVRSFYTRPESGAFIFESEILLALGAQAWTFFTAYDPKPYYNRPYDTIDHINFENLRPQIELLYCELKRLLTLPKEIIYENLLYILGTEPERFWKPPEYTPGPLATFPPNYHYTDPQYNVSLNAPTQNWQKLWGRVGVWNRTKAWYDNVPNALIRLQGIYGPPASENFVWWLMADENGYFEVWGVSPGPESASFRQDAFVFNQSTGMIIYAPDFGLHTFAPEKLVVAYAWMTPLVQDMGYTVVFKASPIILFDNVNPATLAPPRAAESAGAATAAGGAEGAAAGKGAPGRQRVVYTLMVDPYKMDSHILPESYGRFVLESDKYSISMVLVPPNDRYELVLRSPGGLRYPLAFLINASDDYPDGRGYFIKPNQQLILTHTNLHYAKNLYYTSEARFEILSKIDKRELQKEEYFIHEKVGRLIHEAEEEIKRNNYSKAFECSSLAWRLARNVYLYTRPKIEDAASTVPILAVFLIPFALLFEKLVVNAPGRKKIPVLLVIFAVTLASFYFIHPGFNFAVSPIMIVLGFSILILTLPILAIAINQVLEYMRAIRIKLSGEHEARVGRGAIAIWSFVLGIENMRRRKLRTSLVFFSMLCLIIAFMNLASIERFSVVKSAPTGETPTYQGIYIHRPSWGEGHPELGESIIDYLTNKYGKIATVAPRAWAYSDYSSYTDYRAGWPVFNPVNNESIVAQALLGLTPQEANVTKIDKLIVEGRWFLPTDLHACILSEDAVKKLDLKLRDTVRIAGLNLTLVGIISNAMDSLVDIDGEGITPIKMNWREENPYNVHLLVKSLSEGVAIVPYRFCISVGGEIASVSIVPKDPKIIESLSEEIFNFFTDLPIYYGIGDQTWIRTASMSISAFGIESQIILWVILFFSILDIMLGNVHERAREISIYGTVGLSPMHTAFMFFSEACVYAIVGGILGYILSLAINHVVSFFYPGTLIQNFGSSQVVNALLLSMASMIVSTLYPMYKASKSVVPSLERVWRIPTSPVGDHWTIPYPFFATTEEEVKGIMAYLHEYAQAHIGERPPEFKVSDLRIESTEVAGAHAYILKMRTRLFPYEAAVSQDVSINFMLREGRWGMTVELNRISGTTSEWQRINGLFLDLFRKQMLVWRGLPQKEKEKYTRRFKEIIES